MAYDWTEERVAMLTELWGRGLSGTQIANALPGEVTRNAVMGKAHRLKLGHRVKPPKSERLPKRDPRGDRGGGIVASVAARIARNDPAPRDLIVHPDEPASHAVPLEALSVNHCRWPHGDPREDVTFCGHERKEESAYCAYHHARAHVPDRPRTRVVRGFLR